MRLLSPGGHTGMYCASDRDGRPIQRQDAMQADRFARAAIECSSMEPIAFAVHGQVASYLYKDFDLAFRRFEAALRINANAAPAWMWSAAAHAWMGNGPRAIEEINKAMALSPYDPLMYAYNAYASIAYLVDGQYERAIECALRSLTGEPNLHGGASAAGNGAGAGRPRERSTGVGAAAT